MEILELDPLKKKSLKLILVESEFPIDWWFEAPAKERHDLVWNLHLITNEYLKLIEDLIDKHHPNFVVEEKGSRWEDTFSYDDPLRSLFRSKNITYSLIDISENAEGYLSAALENNRTLIKKLSRRIEELIKKNGRIPKEEFDFQRMLAWKQYLQQEYESQENEIRYIVREAWMMMKILNMARKVKDNKLKGAILFGENKAQAFVYKKMEEEVNEKELRELLDVNVYVCQNCRMQYDEAKTGIDFDDLPEDFKCPGCGGPKSGLKKTI